MSTHCNSNESFYNTIVYLVLLYLNLTYILSCAELMRTYAMQDVMQIMMQVLRSNCFEYISTFDFMSLSLLCSVYYVRPYKL